MPRSTKESSDDENDAKAGRRTKTIGSVLNAVTDSPLRRSTRNKPTISPSETAGDASDGSSIISAVSSVQSGRNTRRRTITTISESTTTSESLPTRSLRSRKTSTTSTTSLDSFSVDPIVVIADCESQKDNAKSRITRKSTSAAVSNVDTPPATRFRRQIRAGSESKTMSPSNAVRTTRRTRASSVDLDEQRDEVKPIINCNVNNSNQHSTPVKTRKRASVLPSEPSVVEEVENISQNSHLKSLSTASIVETDDNNDNNDNNDTQNLVPVNINNDSISQQQEQLKIKLDTLQQNINNYEAIENNENDDDDDNNNDNNNNNNNNNNDDDDEDDDDNNNNNNDDDVDVNVDDDSHQEIPNQTKSSSPVLQHYPSTDESKTLDKEMSIINDSEKISSSVTSEIKSPIKNDSPLITYKISTTINNDDKDDGNSSNINPLSPKISTVINPNVSLKSPIHETKNNNLVDDINESLEKSPSGNKENVKPLSSNNICNNFESITSVSSDIKSTNNESIDSIVLTTSSNTTTIVSTSDVVVNSSFDIDTTQQSNNLNSSLSKSNSQQKKCILESTDNQDCNIINLLSESSTEDVILVKNSLIEKIEKTEALPAVSTSTERPTDITDESANKDNTDIPLSVSSPLSLYIKNDKEQNNDEIDSNKSIPLSPTAALESDKKIKINEECNVENDNENEDIESLFYDIPADEWSDDIEVAKSPVEIEIKKVLPEIPKITISKSETNNQQSNIVNDNNDNDKSANLDIDLKNNSDNNQENKRQLQDIDIDCNNDSNETIILTQNDNQTLKLYTENKNKFTKIQESMDINSDEDNDTEIESDLGENNKNVHLLGSNETKKQKQQHINNNENKSDNVSLSSPLLNENKNNSINLSEKNSSPYRKKGNNSDITGELSLSSSSSSSILLANNKKNINIESKHLLRKSLDSAKLIMDNDKAKTSNNTKKKQLNSTIDSRLNLSTNSTEQHNNSNIENNLSISESEIKDNEDKSSIPLILNESNKQNSSSISLNSKQQEGSVYQNDSFSSDNKFHKNYNKINSDSDNNNNDDDDDDDDEDEDDNNNENEDDDKINNYGDKNNSKTKITAPSVLLNDESSSNDYDSSPSENDNSDMDSDVAREYNFNGDSECEYSDDNVVGDECRDSETEHSDEDDDGQDLADFIDDDGDDDDDEDDDDDKEDTTSSLSDDIDTPIIKDIEENEDDENLYEKEEDEEEKEIETDVNEDDDDEEENYKDGLSKVQKLLKFDSNTTFNDNYNHKEDDNLLITHNLSSKVLDKSSRKSLNKLSPITKAKSCNSTPINIKLDSQVSKSADTKLEKRKYKKMIEDELNDSKINSVERVKKLKSSVSLSSQSVHLNKSMELLNVVDNDAVVLMKEKLNETLPSIKLVQPNDNDQSLSKKTRSKNYENNKENDLSKDKKNKNLNVKLTTKNTNKFQEKGAKKNKMNKASLLEADNVKGVELKLNKSEKNKTTECNLNLDNNHVDNYHELTDIESKKIIKKKNKEKKDNLLKVKSNSKDTLSVTNCLKRLSDQVIDKLSENQPKKKRKLSAVATEKILPTRKMFDAKHPKPDNMIIETENEFIPLSSNGGTTSFAVVNINKTSKHQTKKSAAAFSFRQRILGRNSRHPISAYLMYQQKLKASSRDKY